KKLGRVLQPEISGMVCVRVRSCSTPPPFPADKKYPWGSFPRGGFPGAAFGPHWVGRLVTSFIPGSAPRGGFSRRGIRPSLGRSAGYQFHAWVCHILATFDHPLAGI